VLTQELTAAQAGRKTAFPDQAALDATVLQLSERFVKDAEVRVSLQRAFPTAFEYAGPEDLYVLSELGEVSVAGTTLLSVDKVVEHVRETQKAGLPSADTEEVGQAQQELVVNPIPPASVSFNAGLFTIRGESKCTKKFSGDDNLGNLVRCTGTTRVTGNWWWSPPNMENLSVRVVEIGGAIDGHVVDEGWKSYPCPLVKCAVTPPYVLGEARRAVANSKIATHSIDEYAKCLRGCGTDSIITFHALDHGGQTFRFQTSTIVPQASGVDIDWRGYGQDYEVPWVYNGGSCGGADDGWVACRGTGCAPCKEHVDAYPRYFTNHPKCVRNTTCNGEFYRCSANCPAPTAADL
jgi:hypothetical protein